MSIALTTHKVAAVLLALSMVFSVAFVTPASAATVEELTAQINSLLATIAGLQAQLGGLTGGSTTTGGTSCAAFTLNHQQGQTGGEIMAIQKFLNANGFTVSVAGAGSPGNETSTFGPATKAAVMKFQAAKGISPVAGYWGPLTRAAANSMCTGTGTGTGTTPVPTGTGITVSAAAQPGNSLAVKSAARVPFTKFVVTNNSGTTQTVNGVTVELTGLVDSTNFAGIVLLDENGAILGNSQTLNSNDQATIGGTITLNPGQTRTFTVAGNMASSVNSGEVGAFAVLAINTTATVAGSLPITGAQHTMNNTLTLGSVTAGISSFDPQTIQQKNIGDTGVRFAGIRVQAGASENVKLMGVRFRLNGSASASDLSNVMVNVDGVDYPAAVSADGRYYSAMIPNGLLIEKGFNKDLYIKGDITGSNASGRIVQMDIDRKTDLLFIGETYGYGITPGQTTFGTIGTAQTGSALQANDNPWYQGADISVSGASVTSIGKANEVTAQNIAVNVPNVTLGGFYTDIKGETLNVSSIKVGVTYSARPTTADILTNVTLVDQNGVVVAGPVDEVQTGATTGTITFSNQITIPTGKHVWTIKGKVDPQIANNATIILATTPNDTSFWTNVTGQITGNSVTLPGGSFNMNTMTIRTASLTPAINSGLAAQNIVAGVQAAPLAMIDLDATASGEDIRISAIPTTITVGTLTLANLSSCQIFDGAVALNTGSNVPSSVSATQTFTLDTSLVVPKGTKKTVTLKCNVQSGVTGTIVGGVPAGASWTGVTGVTSGNSITPTNGAVTANTQTVVATGSYTVALDASSPAAVIVPGGTNDVTLGIIKVRSTNEDIDLKELLLELTSGTSASLAGSQVTVWDGTTQVGTASITGATGNIVYFSPSLRIVKDTDKKLTIKANMAMIGTNQPGVAGAAIQVNYDNDTLASTKATGVASGTEINPTTTADTATAGVVVYRSFPSVAKLNVPSSVLTTGTVETARFSVTADAAGDVGLAQVTVDTSVSGATVTAGSVYVYAYTDSAFSIPVAGFTSGLLNTTGVNAAAATKVAFDSALQVPAGQTRYFKVVATVTAAAAGNSISTKILGDSAVYALNTGANAKTNRNFVWSGNSQGTSALTATDWTGGFSIVGLPALGTDTTVLSKN